MKVELTLLSLIFVVSCTGVQYELKCTLNELGMFWPDYDDITQYYHCQNIGESVKMTCNKNTVFSFVYQSCTPNSEYIPTLLAKLQGDAPVTPFTLPTPKTQPPAPSTTTYSTTPTSHTTTPFTTKGISPPASTTITGLPSSTTSSTTGNNPPTPPPVWTTTTGIPLPPSPPVTIFPAPTPLPTPPFIDISPPIPPPTASST